MLFRSRISTSTTSTLSSSRPSAIKTLVAAPYARDKKSWRRWKCVAAVGVVVCAGTGGAEEEVEELGPAEEEDEEG